VTEANTLFLRLEGHLQSWGDTSKFVIRRTMDAPTKSGVLGLICCALGISRQAARDRLPELNTLSMGVRIDRRGIRWWDYHTVGAGTGMTTAAGDVKTDAQGTLISRREYLADASFLVALQGDEKLILELASGLASPHWPIYLGRRSCPPSVPVFARPRKEESWSNPSGHDSLLAALDAVPWCPRYKHDAPPPGRALKSFVEWRPAPNKIIAPDDAEVWYDVPVCFDPPVHQPRFVLQGAISPALGAPVQTSVPPLPRPRADYKNTHYKNRRKERLNQDHNLCVFCKSPATTVQHVTYRRAGGHETIEDLRALCGLCHDAVTMIEYGLGMGLDRIDPVEPRWRDQIRNKRLEIIQYRSLETRSRALEGEPNEED
jgi:CRISPR-associated protein Cas5/CasD subtype I-E